MRILHPRLLLAAALVFTGFTVASEAPAMGEVRTGVRAAEHGPDGDSGPAVHHDTSPPLRTLHGAPVVSPRPHPVRQGPHPSAVVKDPVVQKGQKRAAPLPVDVSFDGIGSNNYQVPVVPPDPNASVGDTQIVEVVNLAYAVYTKTGATVLGPTATNTLWTGFGGPCETTDDGDPVVRWDTLARRWVITKFANAGSSTGPYHQCVAVSTSPDATGSYNRYDFSYSDFNDYPKLSVWPDAYYVTYNMFSVSTGAFLGVKVCALDRANMLAGAAATQQCFDDADHFGVLPADLDGSTPPPTGEPELVVGLDTNTTLAYWKFHVDWSTPANSTFTGPSALPVAPFTIACIAFPRQTCIPQGGTTQRLEALSEVMMYRLAYRNFGDHESLVVNHSVAADSSVGVRWYELRLAGGNPTVYQQGTYAPDDTYRWMGSIAQDRLGDIALGYSQSSGTTFPSIRFTGRRAADPLGTLPLGETTVLPGGGSQTRIGRWGDYTSMAVDPTDDCTFWYTNQYQPETGAFNWHTRIASFRLPECTAVPPPSLTIAKSHSGNFTRGGTGVYTVTVGNSGSGPTDGTTVSVHDTLPAGLTAGGLSGIGWSCTLATLTCTRSDVLAAGGSYPPLTLTVNVAADAPDQVTNTVTVTGGGDGTTHTAVDPTTIARQPAGASLTIAKSHARRAGERGKVNYTLTVGNSGTGPTDGSAVTVTDILPRGLTARSLSGIGWSCTLATLTCTRSDVLAAGGSYPPLTLKVTSSCRSSDRGTDDSDRVTNIATVTGGGDSTVHTATDTTTLKHHGHCRRRQL
ncbi:hypothetical protein [Streptomyces sp. NPDC007264]|uniref:hypothetical protein n=1 Tax=Streptomyces sp. NPDC007264 TaxID=3364777 RepID=UPI0036DC3E30